MDMVQSFWYYDQQGVLCVLYYVLIWNGLCVPTRRCPLMSQKIYARVYVNAMWRIHTGRKKPFFSLSSISPFHGVFHT